MSRLTSCACARKRFPIEAGKMNRPILTAMILALPIAALADDAKTNNVSAEAIVAQMLASRPLKDFSLKARLFVTQDNIVPVEILIKNTREESRTIYRADKVQFLVIQGLHGDPHLYLRGSGELKGTARMGELLGSHFSFYDLALPFLHWPNPKFVGEERVRGRDCFAIDMLAINEPYARVKIWVDKEYGALLRAEAFDENQNPVKRIAITSFRRVGATWIPRGIDIAFVPKAQSLPSEEKSRLEVYDGNYDAQLPQEWFSADGFAAAPNSNAARSH
jgi:outer membrane lipoprotein-sorting protein